jgi:hypothetical protein
MNVTPNFFAVVDTVVLRLIAAAATKKHSYVKTKLNFSVHSYFFSYKSKPV